MNAIQNNETVDNEYNYPYLPLTDEDISAFQSKKWNEKCEQCESLIEFVQDNKNFNYNYQLLSIFVEMNLNDPNIKVNSSMFNFLIECTQVLLNDGQFKYVLISSLPKIVNKYKEKKEKLNDEINILLTNTLKNILNIGEFLKAIRDFPNDKSIIFKSNVAEFIFVNLRKTLLSELLMGNTLNLIIEIFGVLVKDSNLDVKNCALSCLALVRKRVGRENFENCDESRKLSDELKYDIVQIGHNINYNKKYDDVHIDEGEEEDVELEEIEEEIEEFEEEVDEDEDEDVIQEIEKENEYIRNKSFEESESNFIKNRKDDIKENIRDNNNSSLKDINIKEGENEEMFYNDSDKLKVKEKQIIIEEEYESEHILDKQDNDTNNQIQNENFTTKENFKSIKDFERKVNEALEKEEQNQKNKQVIIDESPIKQPIKKTEEEQLYSSKILELVKDNTILECFETTKWDEKKKGLSQINQFIDDNKSSLLTSKYDQDTIYNFIRLKINNFKETNFNILKEAYKSFTLLISLPLDKKYIVCILKGVYEKISDSKLKESTSQLINQMIESYGPFCIISQLVTLLLDKKAKLQVMKEYCSFFEKIINDYGTEQLDIKQLITFCVSLANNSNQQARTAAIGLICTLYRYIGSDIKILIKDIKESTIKVIEGEMEKIKVLDKKEIIKPKKQVQQEENKQKDINKNLIARIDISKQINNNILNSINNGKWNDKKEAVEIIQKVLIQANNKIQPNGLKELMSVLKSKLSDPNKNIVRLIIQLLSQLIEALGPRLKQYTKLIGVPLLYTLSDKQSLLRDDCQLCIEKWITSYNFESIVSFCPPLLKNENFELRTEILKILIKNKDKFTSGFSEGFFKEIIPYFLLCLQDKANSIRSQIEEMIIVSLKFVPIKYYDREINEFKPVIANMLKDILQRLCSENHISLISEEERSSEILNSNNNNNITLRNNEKKNNLKQLSLRRRLSKTPNKIIAELRKNKNEREEENKSPNPKLIKKEFKSSTQMTTDCNTNRGEKTQRTRNTHKLSIDKSIGSCSVILNHKIQINNDKPSLSSKSINIFLQHFKIKSDAKSKRYDLDKKSKFTLESQNFDYITKLKDQFKFIFTSEHISKMFNDDIKKNIIAINSINSHLLDKSTQNHIVEILDLILKQIAWKFSKGQNPSLVKSFYELCDSISQVYTEEELTLNSTEANILFNLLCEKLTSPNNTFKDNSLSYISAFASNFGNAKSFYMIIFIAIAKQGKLKGEIVEIINTLYATGEIDESTLRKSSKHIMKLYSSADSLTKGKLMPLIKEIYNIAEDEIVKWCNELNVKEKKILMGKIAIKGVGNEHSDHSQQNESEEEKDKDKDKEEINNDRGLIRESEEKKEESINRNMESNENKEKDKEIKDIKEKKENANQISKEELEFILSSLNNPKVNIIESILAINAAVYKNHEINAKILQENSDLIYLTFIKSLTAFFSSSPLQVKVTKYITNVLLKISSFQDIISKLTFNTLNSLITLILNSVLYDNLCSLGDKEGMKIWKSLNSLMLRVLDFCDPTNVLKILIKKEKENFKDRPRLAEYSARCLVKQTESLTQKMSLINIPEILSEIHLLLIEDDGKVQSIIETNIQSDFTLMSIKNLVVELTKIRKEGIIQDYIKGIEGHSVKDIYIKKWIRERLDSINGNKKKADANKEEKVSSYNTIELKDNEKNKMNENYHTIQHGKFDMLKQKLSNLNQPRDVNVNHKSAKVVVYKKRSLDNSGNNKNSNSNKSFNQIQKKWKDILGRSQNKQNDKNTKTAFNKSLDE